MAAINHYAPGDSDGSDTDIETDLLYAYPYGPHTQYSLESLELYKNEMYFLPGRLPIPVGSGVSYLENYLTNSVKAAMGGLNIRKIYAQSDPHWQEATAATLKIFEDAGLLEKKRRGLGLANIIYLKKFIATENQEVQTLDFRSQERNIPRSTDFELQEV